jgi:hypothetical protein
MCIVWSMIFRRLLRDAPSRALSAIHAIVQPTKQQPKAGACNRSVKAGRFHHREIRPLTPGEREMSMTPTAEFDASAGHNILRRIASIAHGT